MMKRIACIDCQSGVSGDMFLGAIVDAGISLKKLEKGLSALPLKGYKLSAKKVKRGGFRATKVDVEIQGVRGKGQGPRTWKDVERIIEESTLSYGIKKKGLRIFKRLFQAEAKVHGSTIHKTHLHELAAVDCMVDIFGTLIGLDLLGIEGMYASPINLGSGFIESAHGRLPVPAPATLELLVGIPVYSTDIQFELTTPTGAVIISSIADDFGYMPKMEILRIGVGAGSKDFKNQPNVLRLFIGKSIEQEASSRGQEIMVIETNIDDMNPQVYEYVMERLFESGALDVFLANVIMKKGRPGSKLTVLCHKGNMEDIIRIILKETTTIGLRYYCANRRTLQREIKTVKTVSGKVSVKLSRLGDEIIKISPEYSDCLRIAKRKKIPLLDVIKEVTLFLTTNNNKLV